MRIFFVSGILLWLFFKTMILKIYIWLEKGLQKLENKWEQETTFTLYIYIYIYCSRKAYNIIHYSCKCIQQVHMIPYSFVHIEYKLYKIKLLCKFAITLRAIFSYLDNNFHLPFIKSIESCFSIIKITKQNFFSSEYDIYIYIFFLISTNQTCFWFQKYKKIVFSFYFSKKKKLKIENKNCYQT